jgi:hypothetical protein
MFETRLFDELWAVDTGIPSSRLSILRISNCFVHSYSSARVLQYFVVYVVAFAASIPFDTHHLQ